jgi:hypothetical protein
MSESTHDAEAAHLFCHRCGRQLRAGAGDWYIVRIEALADPSPPSLSAEDIEDRDLNAEFSRLFEQMDRMSERELLEQVHRRLTIHLCAPCYRQWIENPAG